MLRWCTGDRTLRAGKYDVVFYLPAAGKALIDREGLPSSGGAETQVSILMRELASKGHRVALISYDLPGGVPASVKGIDIFVRRAYAGRLGRRIGVLRRVFGLLTESFTVFSVGLFFPANSVVQRTASVNTGLLALGCAMSGRHFVWSSASDVDFRYAEVAKSKTQFRVYRWGVRSADEVVVQTGHQSDLCKDAFGREPAVIPSLAEPATPASRQPEGGPILWIGRAIDYKDPLGFVEIAKANPEINFAMIVVPEEGAARNLFDEVKEACGQAGNIEFHGPLNRGRVLEITGKASAMANTSTFEGMPNTFLEGWARGVPAVSLNVDPDGVIERFELGGFANGDPARFTITLRKLVADSSYWERVSSNCLRYVESSHSPDVIARKWEEVLHLRNSTAADTHPVSRKVA